MDFGGLRLLIKAVRYSSHLKHLAAFVEGSGRLETGKLSPKQSHMLPTEAIPPISIASTRVHIDRLTDAFNSE